MTIYNLFHHQSEIEANINNPEGNFKKSLMQHERDLLIKTLEEFNYNKTKVSHVLLENPGNKVLRSQCNVLISKNGIHSSA